MTKHYYLLELTQRSPLRISAGFGEQTDSDVIKDRRGKPFIPGSSLAGVLRSEFDPETADRFLGFVAENGRTKESCLLVSDAVLPDDAKVRISMRDGVGLNERKTAIKGAKYDFEVAEADKPYRAVLELTDERYRSALEDVLSRWSVLGVALGARTTRGYGWMDVTVQGRGFTFPDELDAWLSFDPFQEDAFSGCEVWSNRTVQATEITVVRATLKMKGTYSVRMNTSALVKPDEHVTPDTVPMEDRDGKPVIPGTSWAGAFRHHMRTLAEDLQLGEDTKNELERLFGSGGREKRRSDIRFGETAVEGSHRQVVTRNAVERFTSAPRNQGLFTSESAVGGTGELTVLLPANTAPQLKGLLGVTICDLHLGLLGFGGENGVGRGIAEITDLTVNGQDRTAALQKGDAAAIWEEGAK